MRVNEVEALCNLCLAISGILPDKKWQKEAIQLIRSSAKTLDYKGFVILVFSKIGKHNVVEYTFKEKEEFLKEKEKVKFDEIRMKPIKPSEWTYDHIPFTDYTTTLPIDKTSVDPKIYELLKELTKDYDEKSKKIM